MHSPQNVGSERMFAVLHMYTRARCAPLCPPDLVNQCPPPPFSLFLTSSLICVANRPSCFLGPRGIFWV